MLQNQFFYQFRLVPSQADNFRGLRRWFLTLILLGLIYPNSASGLDESQIILQKVPKSKPTIILSQEQDLDEDEDSDLGTLRLQEVELSSTPSEPIILLLGGVGYLQSDNLFSSDIDPIDDSLIRTGLTLVAVPSLGSQTSLLAAVNGSLIRYQEQSEFDYDQLRLNVEVRQQLTQNLSGTVGWQNQQLFTGGQGDRFLDDNAVYGQLDWQQPLNPQVTLNSFYQFRQSFADPTSRSQNLNSLGVSLEYQPLSSLEVALDYQVSFANFTEQNRDDQYHQIISRLSYQISPRTQIYLFGGGSFGHSSEDNINFDGFLLGVGLNFNLPLLSL